jgi:hypothetical protein
MTAHTAGDTYTATLTDATRPATAGWSAQMVLIGPSKFTITGTAAGDAFTFTDASTTDWPPGAYQVKVLYTLAGARTTVDAGSVQVLPNPTDAGTDARSLLGEWERILVDLKAAYAAHIASGRAVVGSYSIGGRAMTYQTTAELLRAINNAETMAARERTQSAAARGESTRVRYHTRM